MCVIKDRQWLDSSVGYAEDVSFGISFFVFGELQVDNRSSHIIKTRSGHHHTPTDYPIDLTKTINGQRRQRGKMASTSVHYQRSALWILLISLMVVNWLEAVQPSSEGRNDDNLARLWRTRRHGLQHLRQRQHFYNHPNTRGGDELSLVRDGLAFEESGRRRRSEWTCPQVSDPSRSPAISCQCDLPHTLRCAGGQSTSNSAASSESISSERQVAAIIDALRALPLDQSVSLLDLSIQNFSRLGSFLFERVTLHGLVISSGEIQDVSSQAFAGLASSLTALGLPNNRLSSIPSEALSPLVHLERLDLSNNRIQSISGQPFAGLDRLRFLDLSGNALETIAPEVFAVPSGLRSLQLRSNLLEASQLVAPAMAGLKKLQEIDLGYNRLRGRLTSSFLQGLDNLITLELTGNNLTFLKRGMLSGLKRLRTLRLARNQVSHCSPCCRNSINLLKNRYIFCQHLFRVVWCLRIF